MCLGVLSTPLGFRELCSHSVVGFLLDAHALTGDLFMSLLPNQLHAKLMLSQSSVFKSLDDYAALRGSFVKRRLLTLPKRVQLQRSGMTCSLTGFSEQPMFGMMHAKHLHPRLLTRLFQHVDETGM